ncbi:MAG: site-2 protease family protein [Anaerolineae bacterium]|jgi:Zn-dependent protease/predicted transcriptional regulator
MLRNSIRIARIGGISINIHVSWILIFILVTWTLAAGYFPQNYPHWSPALSWSIGVITSILFFVSVLLHELAHSFVARARGLPVHDITLFIFGGVSQLEEEPQTAATEFIMALVGPLTSIVLGVCFGAMSLTASGVNEPLAALGMYLGRINVVLGLFNLIPGFPLDGGRVLRSIVWQVTGSLQRATRWASLVGQAVAYLFILAGIWFIFTGDWVSGLWIAFIGWFLDNAASSSYRQLTVRNLLVGHKVREVMSRDCLEVSPELTLASIVNEHVLPTGTRCFPVVEGGVVRGLLTLHNIKGVSQDRWASTTVRQVMTPSDGLKKVGPDEELWTAMQNMTEEGVNQLPVMDDGHLLGMLGRDNIVSFIRVRGELGI